MHGLPLLQLVAVGLLILVNAFFVAAEFAMVSVRDTRIDQMAAAGVPGARAVQRLQGNLDDFLPAVQLGVTLCSLALGWIGEPLAATMFLGWMALLPAIPDHAQFYAHLAAIVLSFAFITYLQVLVGELVPKSLALQRAERIALAVAGPMDVFIRMTRPAIKVMNFSATMVLKLFQAPLRGESGVHSPEELKMLATATRRVRSARKRPSSKAAWARAMAPARLMRRRGYCALPSQPE